jgi:hypothetical protein
MNTTAPPADHETILADYAESCRLRFIETPDDSSPSLALHHPDAWLKTCRETTRKAITEGEDTWERIAAVAAKHKHRS